MVYVCLTVVCLIELVASLSPWEIIGGIRYLVVMGFLLFGMNLVLVRQEWNRDHSSPPDS